MASIFLEITLPNATTWFYFSLLLAIALFFKFSRVLSLRNWDILSLFLLVPGLLLLQEGREQKHEAQQWQASALTLQIVPHPGNIASVPAAVAAWQRKSRGDWLMHSGYLSLLLG